jgi:hypothetical protein
MINEFILWKLYSIWLKILNDIACNSNWIQIHCIHEIQLKINEMQIDANGVMICFGLSSFITMVSKSKTSMKTHKSKNTPFNVKIVLWEILKFEIIQN